MLPVIQLDNMGLYTFPNVLSKVPPGAMTIANNIDIDRPGVAETRRGFEFYGNVLPASAIKGYVYDDNLIWYLSNGSLVYDSNEAGDWLTYAGSFFPPAGGYLFSTQSSGNFYFTTNNGVYKLDSISSTPVLSGVPQALDLQGAISGSGNAVLSNSQVMYQVVFGYTDLNNNLILGAPSEFLFVANSTGSTQAVTIEATIPNGLTTDYFIQLYRTANTNSLSVPPGNNAQLIIEHQLTSGELAAKTVTLVDNIPDTLLGAFIYTADGQPTPQPNTQPPLCFDLCTFNGMTFYANFSTRQTSDVTLDSVGSPNGIQIGDTFTLTDDNSSTSYVYTGASSNNAAARQFAIVTSGSIAQNIDSTARNLVAMINQDPGNAFFYAQYITGENILPGAIQIQAQNLQNGIFHINSSRQTCWTPPIPAAGTDYSSSNNSQPSGIIVSKVNQPEAAPLVFELQLQSGIRNIIIFRVVALQDAVYAFTTGGVFRITGSDPTALQTLLFDSSANIKGLNTPEILNNSIYYMATQGICSISSGGNQIMSRNIERDLLATGQLTDFNSIAYGCSYESDRAYFLFTPSLDTPTLPIQEYRYNWLTQTFTLWTRETTAAIVSTRTDKLYFADSAGNIFEERKSFTDSDFADESYPITITNVDTAGLLLTLVSAANVRVGDVILQSPTTTNARAQVTSIDLATNIVGVAQIDGLVDGIATDYRSIVTEITYAPLTAGFAEYMKKWTSLQFMFSNANFAEVTIDMSSDIYPTPETGTLIPVASIGGWGTKPFGTFAWGVSTIPQQLIPTWPTPNTVYSHWMIISLSLTQAFTSFALDGISATFDITGTRGR